jgi:hypothetical protein
VAAVRSVLRWILAVLASVWFAPVSCVTAMGAGSSFLIDHDARDAARGDTVHSSIAVVALPSPAPERAFRHLLLGNVPSYKKSHPEITFLMPAKEGRIEFDSILVSYRVTGDKGGEQIIETQYQDGDRAAWGRYRATKNEVTPLASRLSASDYIYYAFPFALAAAFLIWFGAGLLRRRARPA